ncbi:MAG: ComF family protein [Vicinamibacterales bacterium]
MHALKYDGRRSVAAGLGALMRVDGADVLADAHALVPVPLHPARLRSRGFNQAEDLAHHLGVPVVRALRRTRHTDAQANLTARDRVRNVSGAFAATRAAAAIRGATVVLVDDVRTTGATLDACALTLRECGVRGVRVLTAARVAPSSL